MPRQKVRKTITYENFNKIISKKSNTKKWKCLYNQINNKQNQFAVEQ